ncbi:MAG: oxidoreductase [Candidatus Saccharibacteria bacterium]|nr:oxidoreductase [Candidatus Saccharibacteria bacterium]
MSSDTILTFKPTDWRVGTVTEVLPEALGLRSYAFTFDAPIKHDAGQHYEIRLTAKDGYQAARLYSAAMPANGSSNMLQLTIALMPRGEVSSYIFNNVKTGSQLEIRGPFGRHFIWTPKVADPVLLVGGGTGVIPLRAMRLQHQQASCQTPMKLLYSTDSYTDMPYKYELFPHTGVPAADVTITFTEQAPHGWKGYDRRIDTVMIRQMLMDLPKNPLAYVCGPTPMVETAIQALLEAGLDPAKIKAERFGSTAA